MIMLCHLLKLIANRWKANLWILAELFLSFVCLFGVFFFLLQLGARALQPCGFDIDHVYQVVWTVRTAADGQAASGSDPAADLGELVSRLRRYPGVEAVCVAADGSYPYAPSSYESILYRDTLEAGGIFQGQITPDAIRVFRYESIDPAISLMKEAGEADCLLSRKRMEELFGPGTIRGYVRLEKNKPDDQLALAVDADVARCEYFDEDGFCWWLRSEAKLLKHAHPQSRYVFLRVRPEVDSGFTERFLKEMHGRLQAGDCLITNLIPVERQRAQILSFASIDFYYTGACLLAAFFLVCAFLGIIGTFWFRTQARTSEIGIRMAMGATSRDVRRLFVGEGLVLFALVWVPGVVIAWLLRHVVSIFADRIPFDFCALMTILFTTLVMALLIVAGIWVPARQASRINPVDALRYE